jgi:hypothetical protein
MLFLMYMYGSGPGVMTTCKMVILLKRFLSSPQDLRLGHRNYMIVKLKKVKFFFVNFHL